MKYFLLEDDLNEAAFFISCMVERGDQVMHCERAAQLFDALHAERPGVVVLDCRLPDVDGLVTLRRVRELCGWSLPVVMLSGLDRAEAIVEAFECGADDYLLKPMSRPVLLARLGGLTRRLAARDAAGSEGAKPPLAIEHGPYRIDFNAHVLTIDGRPAALTPKELDLAWVLFKNADRFVSKAELIATVWGRRAEISPHTVTQHVHVLRTKLALREHGYQLSAVYGSGYRLTTGSARATADLPEIDAASLPPAARAAEARGALPVG